AKVSPYSQLDGEASYFFHITKDLLFWDYLQKRLGFDVLFTAFYIHWRNAGGVAIERYFYQGRKENADIVMSA
ncbi:MAG: hypothetical protein IJ607_01000, partial [Bacteroidaceae bacterium]|nr:hypothetical protein [Bacteroidaceae bacterium]